MSTVAKILVVLNLVLAVAFLASASSYLGNQDTWHNKYNDVVKAKDLEIKTLKGQLDQEKAEKANFSRQAGEALQAPVEPVARPGEGLAEELRAFLLDQEVARVPSLGQNRDGELHG